MERIKTFAVLPWQGGLNTSLDPSMISVGQLTLADNIVFAERGSKKKRDGINLDWDDQANSTESIIGLHDFWYGAATKTQTILGVTDGKKVYTYNPTSGVRSADLFAGTAWGSSVSACSIAVLNNLAVIAVNGSGNVLKKYSGSGNIADLGGTPPAASIVREHLGRMWCNDKTNVDRLHYSTTANPEEWNGTGDSGAIDIGAGDGDPDGITAIFPTFKGVLFVAKRTKLYRISNYTPEDFQVELVSSGVGCISHNSIALIDQDDMFFVSERGVHSISATASYGDFQNAFVSYDIQKTFNDDFTKSRLKFTWGAYLPNLNSYALAVTDESVSSTANNCVWLYNVPQKVWYRWKNVSCQCLAVVNNSDKKRFFLGTDVTRVSKTLNGTNYDINTSGVNTSIPYIARTGRMAPDGNPFTEKAFKWIALYYKQEGPHTITVSVRIDNYPVQSFSFSSTNSVDLLGSTFVLGTSILSSDAIASPQAFQLDGYGRAIEVTVENNGTDQAVEIQGFAIGYEEAQFKQEVING